MDDSDAILSPSQNLNITLTHHGTPHTFHLPSDSTITTLSNAISDKLAIPSAYHKLLITPRTGLLKPPFANPTLPLSTLTSKKILLLAPTPADLSTLSKPPLSPAPAPPPPPRHSAGKPVTPAYPSGARNRVQTLSAATYTFHSIVPLPYLPAPERSLRYLQRLAADAGIRATMAKHRFSVGVLTEMNPVEHTTRQSRTLGLNRNRGEVIELRIRTDAYDGYVDYKMIRKTLCHELAHNVYGDHDRDFWDLTRDIEREVERADWTRGGRALTEEVFYEPRAGVHDDEIDGGGWIGGEYVLGGSTAAAAVAETGSAGIQGLSRREAMAKAAEERMRKQREASGGGGTAPL